MLTLKEAKERRYDLGWLKILATLLLIPYHTARIFEPNVIYPYFVENYNRSIISELLTRFTDQWFMPLFFFIAGAAAKYSLNNISKKQYCSERLNRLLIPFFIFYS